MSCTARRLELTRELTRCREVLCYALVTFPPEDDRVQWATHKVEAAIQALLALECGEKEVVMGQNKSALPIWWPLEWIKAERLRQDRKWGEQLVPDTHMLAVLMEEVGEVAKCLCDKSPVDELRLELVQVAAVAVKWLQMLDMPR